MITTVCEHNSVLRPLYRLQKQGVELSFLSADEQGILDYDKLPALIKENTKVVIVTHASNLRAPLQLSGQDYVLILDQDQSLPVADILKDTVSAMEYDFNIRLSILVGQVWTESKDGKVSPVIRAEQAVFRAWIREGHQGVYRFSQLYLWGIEQADLDLTPIKERLHQLIESQDQLQDIIVALWDNGAVVTKAAQQLYLHRNSLQYKIDKWEELTGLQLKNLTDLALCYHLVLQDVI